MQSLIIKQLSATLFYPIFSHSRQAVVMHAATPCAGSFSAPKGSRSLPGHIRSQGRRSSPVPFALKAGGRRRRGGSSPQPTAAAAGYRQPPGLLRRAAVPIGPTAILLCKPPATRATAALAAKPESQPPSSRCHYSSQVNATIGKLKRILLFEKTDTFFACCFRTGHFAWGISR